MGQAVEVFTREWSVIIAAPWSFVALAVVIAGIVWAFIWLIFRGQISGQKANIDTLKDQIATVEQRRQLQLDEVKKLETALSDVREELSTIKRQTSLPDGRVADLQKIVASTVAASVAVDRATNASETMKRIVEILGRSAATMPLPAMRGKGVVLPPPKEKKSGNGKPES